MRATGSGRGASLASAAGPDNGGRQRSAPPARHVEARRRERLLAGPRAELVLLVQLHAVRVGGLRVAPHVVLVLGDARRAVLEHEVEVEDVPRARLLAR